VAAIGRQSDREIATFDEGELWCADDAVPPMSPAGWYFRAGRGSPAVWIGPFERAGDARVAPFSGDPLRDARKYLDRWQRGDAPPPAPLRLVVPRRAAPLPPMTPEGQFELAVGEAAAPAARGARRRSRRAARAPQLTLPL
jgi:hypothetical protein